MEEINIFSLGFNKNLQREVDGNALEILEDRLNRTLQSGDTVTTSIPGLKEVEYNGI